MAGGLMGGKLKESYAELHKVFTEPEAQRTQRDVA